MRPNDDRRSLARNSQPVRLILADADARALQEVAAPNTDSVLGRRGCCPPNSRWTGSTCLYCSCTATPTRSPHPRSPSGCRPPAAELVTVRGGRHDILNDINHRSVAAHVVQWLERLRSGAADVPIVVETAG